MLPLDISSFEFDSHSKSFFAFTTILKSEGR